MHADIHHTESYLPSHLVENTVHEQFIDYSDKAVIKIKITPAERCREYRMRKKDKYNIKL